MAICSRCGRQTKSAGAVCLSCSDYAAATLLVGAYSATASRGSYNSASEYERPRPDRNAAVEDERPEPEFASLPHFERPFAAQGTVWPDDAYLARSPGDPGASDAYARRPEQRNPAKLDRDERDRYLRDPDEHDRGERGWDQPHPRPRDLEPGDLEPGDLEPSDLEPSDPEPRHLQPGHLQTGHAPQANPDRASVQPAQPEFEAVADSTDAQDPYLDQLTALPHSGRWMALTTAAAVLLVAAAGAATLVVRNNHGRESTRTTKPIVAASPAAASVAPTSQNQLIVDQTAATVPDEAAITASLNRYFDAINNHDYLVYRRTFIMALRSGISPESFSAGFGTTTDSSEQLRSISVLGGGLADAFVTFVSQQATPARAGTPRCATWRMEFFLGQRAGRYLQVATPVLHQASDVSCF